MTDPVRPTVEELASTVAVGILNIKGSGEASVKALEALRDRASEAEQLREERDDHRELHALALNALDAAEARAERAETALRVIAGRLWEIESKAPIVRPIRVAADAALAGTAEAETERMSEVARADGSGATAVASPRSVSASTETETT